MAIDWFRSYTTEWEVVPIDSRGWVAESPLAGVKSFRLATNGDADVPLIQSGSMTLDILDEELPVGWYHVRGRMVSPTGDLELYPLFTMLFESNDITYDYNIGTMSMIGKSVLHPVNTNHMENGEYIPKGTNGAEWCRRILGKCTPAPVVIDGDERFTLNRNYVFDSGTSYLKAVWQVLDAAKWVIQIDGYGVITLLPKPKYPEHRFENEALSLFKPDFGKNTEIMDIPNVYVAHYNGRRSRIENNDPESMVSTTVRGYTKDEIDTDPMPINGEDLDHYCSRQLEDLSTVIRTYTYTREVWEDVLIYDKVYINKPGVFTGEARVLSQSFDCSNNGVQIQEVVGEEVKLWRANH